MPSMPTPWFYLGALGRLVALPAPEPGIDNGIVKAAAQHVSLNAHTTEDVQGYRREWTLSMPFLDADDVAYLEACYLGVVAGPLRLVDPTRRNRLSTAAAATTASPTFAGGTTALRATSGAYVVDRSVPWPDVAYDALDGRAVTWRADDTAAWSLSGSGVLTLDDDVGVPVLPGETVTASVYVQTDGATATLEMVPRTAVGDREPVAGTSTGSARWTRLTATYSASDGVLAVVPRVATDATSGTIRIAAAQVETGDTATGWTLGTGCPAVLVTDLPARSPIYPLVSAELSLREV